MGNGRNGQNVHGGQKGGVDTVHTCFGGNQLLMHVSRHFLLIGNVRADVLTFRKEHFSGIEQDALAHRIELHPTPLF